MLQVSKEKFARWQNVLIASPHAILFEKLEIEDCIFSCYIYSEHKPTVEKVTINKVVIEVESYEQVLKCLEEIAAENCESCNMDNEDCACCNRTIEIKF